MDQDFNDYEHNSGADKEDDLVSSSGADNENNQDNSPGTDGENNHSVNFIINNGDTPAHDSGVDSEDTPVNDSGVDSGNHHVVGSDVNNENKQPGSFGTDSENTLVNNSGADSGNGPVSSSANETKKTEENAADHDGDSNQHFYEYYEVQKDQGKQFHSEEKTPESSKPPKKKKKGSGFGRKVGTAFVVAVVFGLVAGIVFRGVNLIDIPGLDNNTQNATVDSVEVSSADEEEADTSGEETVTETAQTSGAMSVADIAANVMPSVVAITTVSVEEFYDFFGGTQQYEGIGSGSGIIIGQNDDELLIATNNHVVADSTDLNVSFYGDELKGTVLDSYSDAESASELADEYAENAVSAQIKGTDEENDLAVVAVKKADIPEETLAEIKVATMAQPDDVVVGEQVVAIGNALGYGQSVTSGYVSALDRIIESDSDYDYDYDYGYSYGSEDSTSGTLTSGLIQTDAAINPGNSGGALLNMRGEVIGINSAKFADATVEGMGFAIPISTAEPILSDLMTREVREKVSDDKAAYLGITCKEVSEEASDMYRIPTGAFVYEVMEGSAAEEAGILPGDVIVKLEDADIQSYEDLVEELSYYEAGQTVSIVVDRANNGVYEEQTLSVTLGSKKDAE